MKQFFLKLTRFWNEDRSLAITLLLAFVVHFCFGAILNSLRRW